MKFLSLGTCSILNPSLFLREFNSSKIIFSDPGEIDTSINAAYGSKVVTTAIPS